MATCTPLEIQSAALDLIATRHQSIEDLKGKRS